MRSDSKGRLYLAALLFAVAVSALALPQAAHAQKAAMTPDLIAAKAALARYSDPLAAVKDGYYSTVACIDFPKGAVDGPITYPPGAMGVHFLNPSNIGPKLDPKKPQVLIYEPRDGKLVLTAAEWLMPVAASGGVAPSIFGHTLAGPMNGHEPIMPASLRHYDLHVWLWKDNPKGMFTSTNAAVHCSKTDAYTVALGDHHH